MEQEGPKGDDDDDDDVNAVASPNENYNDDISKNILAPFNPTEKQAQKVALGMLLQHHDDDMILCDLGCGDARLLIQAVQQSATVRCIGIERDPVFVDKAVAAAKEQLTAEQQSRIDIRLGDVLRASNNDRGSDQAAAVAASILGSQCRDLTVQDATALFLYLLPKGLVKIQPLLDQLVNSTSGRGGSLRVVVTYMFQVKQWEATQVDRTSKGGAPVYLYDTF